MVKKKPTRVPAVWDDLKNIGQSIKLDNQEIDITGCIF